MPLAPRQPLYYDSLERRLWICGQRCHHGATGTLLACAGVIGLLGRRNPALGGIVAIGAVLMAHDWRDRGVWFTKGM